MCLPFFFFFLMWIAFGAYIIFWWDRLVWKSGPSTQGFTCFEMKTHFDDQVEGRNIPWIGMDVEGIYLPKNGFPLFSYAEGSRNGQPKKGPSPTRRSALGIGASLALGVQLLCSSTWIHNTGLLSWRGEERGQSSWRTDWFRGSFSLARGAGIAGVESQPSTRRFRALTGCGRLSSQFSENNEHALRTPSLRKGTSRALKDSELLAGVPPGSSLHCVLKPAPPLWAGQLISPGVHSPSWLCSGYKVT